ncbi:MAG: hypothetical protein MUF34_04820 [Polyangiaceae bacterium]|nr:hypothetical protein [Polyangiaceae bacterium]
MLRSLLSWQRGRWVVWALALAVGCSGDDDPRPDPTPPGSAPGPCSDIPVDVLKEMLVVDEAVVTDARAKNATDGPWSFRHLIEEMTPPGVSPSEFVLRWLNTWQGERRINGFVVPVRPDTSRVLVCPWLRATPSNLCDSSCGVCQARELDLALAPFRLIGFANRIDLRETEDLGGVGESRLVFGVTEGPGDDPSSKALRMSVIFEFKNPSAAGQNAAYWAHRWHELSAYPAYDESYLAALQSLTDEIVTRGAAPNAPSGSSIGQVRTNEREFDWIWDLREFKLDATGLAPAPTFNTPDKSSNDSPALAAFVEANRELIMVNQHRLPPQFTSGFATPFVPWYVPGVDEELRHNFARHTCDGCHQTEEDPVDVNFHISPLRTGVAKLSPFLYDPALPEGTEEMISRIASHHRALCGQ